MYKIVSLFSFLILIIACTNSNTNTKESSSVESFQDFRKSFYSDTSFQKERILFPLPGINTDDMEINDSIYFWEKDKWRFLTDFSLSDGIKKETTKSDSIVIERMYFEDSGFIVKTEFNLRNNSWFLTRLEISNL